jgi:hypothetical protein
VRPSHASRASLIALLLVVAPACGDSDDDDDDDLVADASSDDAGGGDASLADASLVDAGGALLPDITVSVDRAIADLAIERRSFGGNACELDPDEDCIGDSGDRTLLRFSVETPNLGTADLIMGTPTPENDAFAYSSCHEHYHFLGYAEYRLVDGEGVEVATGRKQAFCLEDSEQYVEDDPTVSENGTYWCGYQGIQRGWSDVYYSRLACQFIDVTDTAPGEYTLRISLNNEQSIEELSYANNIVEIPVTLGDPDIETPTEACPALSVHATRTTNRECGWETAQSFACEPGRLLRVGCSDACTGLGACTGDPMIRVCDSTTTSCAYAAVLDDNDDSCGSTCPRVRDLTCPASGSIDVYVAAFELGAAYTCTMEMEYQD